MLVVLGCLVRIPRFGRLRRAFANGRARQFRVIVRAVGPASKRDVAANLTVDHRIAGNDLAFPVDAQAEVVIHRHVGVLVGNRETVGDIVSDDAVAGGR